MSHPFGGHPTLKRLVDWVEQNGCICAVSIRNTVNGRSYTVLTMRNTKTSGRAMVTNPDFEERLSPSMVSYFQRRLGIKAPFAALPEDGQDSSG
jgi:hypothetical protein